MAKPKGLVCDECGTHEMEPRNWLALDVQNGGASDPDFRPPVRIFPANLAGSNPSDGFTRLDLCGQMCTYRRLGVLLFGETPRAGQAEAVTTLINCVEYRADPQREQVAEAQRKAEQILNDIAQENPGFRGA